MKITAKKAFIFLDNASSQIKTTLLTKHQNNSLNSNGFQQLYETSMDNKSTTDNNIGLNALLSICAGSGDKAFEHKKHIAAWCKTIINGR